MASLAQITRDTRLIAKFGAIGLVVVFFLFISFKAVTWMWGVLNPPIVPPPEIKYGPLISNLPIQSSKPTYSYQVNTITGSLPAFPDRIRVYKTVQPDPDLLALQKARETVRLKGYTSNEMLVSPGVYRWHNSTGGSITYHINSRNFEFSSGIGLEKQDFMFSTRQNITSQVLAYIQDLRSSLIGIDQQNAKITYYTSDGVNLFPEEDVTRAYLAQVDFTQIPVKVDPFIFKTNKSETVETLPIYYQDPDMTNHSFVIKAGSRSLQFVRGMYKNYEVDTTEHSTYPIKTAEEAFADLEKGNAYIISTNQDSVVNITEVTLGYFIPQIPTEYIMPIFVFKGKDFLAYVDALGEYTPPNQNDSN